MSRTTSVRLYLLGAGGLSVAGRPVDIPRAPMRLLAWLALQPRGRAPRRSAALRLWPDLDERDARARLSQCLWTLKQRTADLTAPLVVATPDELRLDERVTVDVDELRRLDSAVDRHGSTNGVDWASYAAPLLEDWDDDWVIGARAVISRMLDDALAEEAERLTLRGEFHDAVRVATIRTELLPHVEAGWRAILALHDQMADVAAARAAYSTMVRHLADIGVTPSPDLTAAHRQRSTERHDESGRAGADRLIGRGRERAELIERLKLASEELGSVVLACGESGIGKSRLLDEFAADARWRGFRPGRSVCTDIEVPFLPVCRAIEAAIAPIEVPLLVDSLDKPWLERAVRLLPGLPWPDDTVARGPDGAASADEDDRQIQTLVEVLTLISGRRTVTLIIDDFHLADRWTTATIRRLADLCSDVALLIVLAFRTTPRSTPPGELQQLDAHPNSTRISLTGLNQRGTYELARLLDERVTRAGADALVKSTGGSPLLIRHLVESVGRSGSDPTPASFTDPGADPIGDEIQTRESTELMVIRVLSVTEERLDVFSLTRTCARAAPEQVANAVLTLTSDGLVTEHRGRYRIAHDRIRTAAMAEMDSHDLRRISAELLALRDGASTPAAEARLATRAGDWTRALQAHERAAREAARLGAVAAAVEHFASATEAARLCGSSDPDVADVLIGLHDMHVLNADAAGQLQTLEQLERLRLQDRWVAVSLRSGWHSLDVGEAHHAVETANEVIAAGGRPTSIRGGPHRLRAEARLSLGQSDLAIAELQRQLSDDTDAPPAERAELLAALAAVQREASEGDIGTAALTEAAALLERADSLDQLTDTERGLGMRLVHDGRIDEGFDRLHSALRSARRLGDRRREAFCLYSHGAANFVLLDRYGSGRPYLHDALALSRSTSYHWVTAISLNNLGFGDAVVLGRVGTGIDLLNEGAALAEEHGLPYWRALCTFSRAEVALRADDDETAEELYEEAERQFIAIGSPQPLEQVLADRALVRARVGAHGEAKRLVERSLAALRSNAHGETAAGVELRLAEVNLLTGELDGAARHARAVPGSFLPGVMEQHFLLWRAATVLDACASGDEADVLMGLAGRRFDRYCRDLGPQLADEFIAQHASLIATVTACAHRCSIVECVDNKGQLGGLRLDVPLSEFGPGLSGTHRDALVAEIAAKATALDLRPRREHLAELFAESEDAIGRRFGPKSRTRLS